MKISSALVSTELDKIPIKHIPCFGACSVTGSPCTPVPVAWLDTYKVKVAGGKTLLFKSKLPCGKGGEIKFLTSGQVPVSAEEMAKMVEENSPPPEEDSGWGWWDTAELIPVVGNVIGMVRSARKGNWGMFALNAGFLVLDVFTLGGASGITATVKGGVKVAAKTAAKAGAKGGAKALARSAAGALAEAAMKSVDDIAKAMGKLCVYACFPAGTKVATEHGQRNIEDIKEGDLVWAYDERTGAERLCEVTDPVRRTVGATVHIEVADETIVTTAEHPFFTRDGWRDAADLQPGNELVTRKGHWHAVRSIDFQYEETEVYNFNVQDLHSYFIGRWGWVAHNASQCLREAFDAARESSKLWSAWGNKARRELAKSLGTGGTRNHAHHIIPLEHLRNMPIVRQAYKNGFGINSAKNGVALNAWDHIGNKAAGALQFHHSSYNKYAKQVIDKASEAFPHLSPEDILSEKVIPKLSGVIDDALKAGETINDYAKSLLIP